jgi:hypothetical protein
MQLQLGGFKKIAASIRSATFVMLLAHVAAPAVAQVRSDAASPDVVAYTHKYALVIGIDKYEDRLWGNLNYPVDDAERIATALEKEHGFEKPIIARNLKSDDFKRVLEQFFAKTGSEDGALLLLWFARRSAEAAACASKGRLPRPCRCAQTQLCRHRCQSTVGDCRFPRQGRVDGSIEDVRRPSTIAPHLGRARQLFFGFDLQKERQ